MPDWGSALLHGQRAVDIGALTATSLGTSITHPGVANTKGSWIQLSASIPFSASFLLVMGTPGIGGFHPLVDIGVGAAAAEYVIAPNLHFNAASVPNMTCYSVPCSIDVGQRLAARMQSNTTSGNANLVLILIAP
jgi:hypothetical protein